MKKRVLSIALVLSLVLCICANAAPRYSDTASVKPALAFSGTSANCSVSVKGPSGAKISVTMTLTTSGGSQVQKWTDLSGTTSLDVSKTCSGLTKGTTYTLTVTAVVGGQTITKTASATCR